MRLRGLTLGAALIASLAPAAAEPVLVVVDSVGTVVGPMLGLGTVSLTLAGQPVAIPIGPEGFQNGGMLRYAVRYGDAACTDPGFLESGGLPPTGFRDGTDIISPGPDLQVRTLSHRRDHTGSDPIGSCTADPTTVRVGTLVRTSVDALALKPPFSVQWR